MTDEQEIRDLIEEWVRAVRARNYDGILARHAADLLMFDVPAPLARRGLDEYRQSWDLFFRWADTPALFEVRQLRVAVGGDVAFAVALMRCAGTEPSGERVALDFRLTIGLTRVGGKWTVVHEHHSVPAT